MFSYNSRTIRATVLASTKNAIVVKPDNDDGTIIIYKGSKIWQSIEKITLFSAHSAEYLRRLPITERPSIY